MLFDVESSELLEQIFPENDRRHTAKFATGRKRTTSEMPLKIDARYGLSGLKSARRHERTMMNNRARNPRLRKE